MHQAEPSEWWMAFKQEQQMTTVAIIAERADSQQAQGKCNNFMLQIQIRTAQNARLNQRATHDWAG